MKIAKWILLFLLILSPICVNAQSWYQANTIVLGWDAVPLLKPTDQPNKYQVYSRSDLVSNGTPIGTETTELKLQVLFPNEGRYYLGVKTVRYPQGETIGQPSAGTSWSNVPADTNNNPFGVMYFVLAAPPINLRKTVP